MNAKLKEREPAIEKEYDLDDDDDKEMYDQMLDECYEPFMGNYPASEVLKQIDEIAYNEGFNDYTDGMDPRWECPECGRVHNDQESAEFCCQTETWICNECETEYDDEEDAENCCADELPDDLLEELDEEE